MAEGAQPYCIAFIHPVGPGMWALAEHPDYYDEGLVSLIDGRISREEIAILRAIARQAPESLASRSELVVVGSTVDRQGRCQAYGKTFKCADVLVDSVVLGHAPPGAVRVHTLYGGLRTYPHVLLMLRPDGAGGYEDVGFGSGVIPISGDSLQPLGVRVEDFVRRLRLSSAVAPTSR